MPHPIDTIFTPKPFPIDTPGWYSRHLIAVKGGQRQIRHGDRTKARVYDALPLPFA